MKQHTPSQAFKLLILGATCLSQGIPLAFIQLGLPTVLRGLEESLTTITMYSLLLLPWAAKFLFASLLDRFYVKTVGKRRTWIILTLVLTALSLFFTGTCIPAKSSPALMGTILVLNLLLSMNDTVVNAYSTDILSLEEMAWGSSFRLGGSYLGMILGGGMVLSTYSAIGWENTFHLLGWLTITLALPAIFHREIKPVHSSATPPEDFRPSTIKFAKSPGIGWFILAEILFVTAIYSAYQLYLPFLVDLGFSSDQIGSTFMYWGYPAAFVTALSSGWVVRRTSARRLMPICMAAAAGVNMFAAWLATAAAPSYWHVALLLTAELSIGSFAGVVLYTMIMEVCVGPQAATSAGFLSSISNFTPILTPPFFGILSDAMGYRFMFGALGGSSLLLAGALVWFLHKQQAQTAMTGVSRDTPLRAEYDKAKDLTHLN